MKRPIVLVLVSLALLVSVAVYAVGETILIYSPWKTEVMEQFTDLFYQQTGIKAESINISTGEIYARLRVEKTNPQCDIWHSSRASILAEAELAGLLASLSELPNAQYLLEHYTYPSDDHFVGSTMYPLVFCYNEEVMAEMGLTPPENYEDLLDSVWKGEIVAPHPAASGTAYAFVTTVLQMYRVEGETGIESAAGWEYLKGLSANVAEWTSSGSTPSKLVARGEYPVGISFYDRIYRLQQEGYPIKAVYPDPVYAEPSCTAVVASAPHPEAAEAFVNFMLSSEAQQLAKATGNYSVRTDIDPPTGAPLLTELNVFEDDYVWAAKNKREIIGEFSIMLWD